MKTTQHRSPYFPDIQLFLVIIPFISAFNYYLTYANIQLNWFLLLTFCIDTIQGYLAWWAVRGAIGYLDRKMPYTASIPRRILVQIGLTIPLGLGIIAVATELVSWIARGKWAPWSFYTIDLPIISIWFWAINGLYIGLYFYRQWEELRQQMRMPAPAPIAYAGLAVKVGNQSLLLRPESIFFLAVEDDYVQLTDAVLRKYVMDASLDKLERQLPATDFFRLNRQCLVHRQIIAGFKRIENGKLVVQLNLANDMGLELTVSRTKAASFKDWFLPQ